MASSSRPDDTSGDTRQIGTDGTRTTGATVPGQSTPKSYAGGGSAPASTSSTGTTPGYDPKAGEAHARERFGGMNLGSGFFGWLVAIGVTLILTGIVGAVATALGYNGDITQSQAQRDAGTIGVTAGVVLIAVLLIGYYFGGYVAGRMARFDGARQGLLVWLIGVVVTVVAVVVGWAAGDQYNVLDRVDLPRIPISTSDLTWGVVITAVAVVLGTLLAAMLGGKIGNHYHTRVDKAQAKGARL